MLIATHEMGFARQVADRVVLPRRRPDRSSRARRTQVLGDPVDPRTRQFLQRIIDAGRL